jgi:hypothetical protein
MYNLKFRVWDKKKKTFDLKRGAYFIRSDGVLERQEAGMGGTDYNDEICYCSTNRPLSPDKYVISYFTGLKDSEDKDIYDGDIVSFFRNGKIVLLRACYLKETKVYNDFRWSFNGLHHGDSKPIKVVGNVFENPELVVFK